MKAHDIQNMIKSFEKSIPSYRVQKEKSNDACFSRIAPSSGEL